LDRLEVNSFGTHSRWEANALHQKAFLCRDSDPDSVRRANNRSF
jgi:hypothetical protein